MTKQNPKRAARWMAVPAVVLALAAAGCGDDEEKSDSASSGDQPVQQSTAKEPVRPAPAEAGNDQPAGGEDAVKDAVLTWTFEGKCEVMTDKFLEQQAFVGDNRQERCDFFEKQFAKPQYKESDVKFRKIAITGSKATATVGSDLADITTDYLLVSEGGSWKIDGTG